MSRANLIIFTRAETASGTLEAIGKLDQYPVSLPPLDCLGSAVSAARALLLCQRNRRGSFFCILRSRQS